MGKLFKRNDIDSPYYYARYKNRSGKTVRKCTMVRDKKAAQDLLTKWESDEQLFAYKVRDEAAERAAAKAGESITSQAEEYEASLVSSRKSQQHVERTIQLVNQVSAECNWLTLGDICATDLEQYAANKLKAGSAARTVSSAITALRSFCRWAVKNGRLKSDPTASVAKPSSIGDRRIERRMLSPDEWRWIDLTLREEPVDRNGQSAAERRIMYWLAIETGLRSNELRQLTRQSVKLSGEPHVLAKAGTTKNKETAKQYLSDKLAAEIRNFIAAIKPTDRLFNPKLREEMAETLREDLAAARRLWESSAKRSDEELNSDFLLPVNHDNEVLDFHSLRHTCGAWLVMQGVTLAEVQQVMRHSTIVLTIDHYGHLAKDARSRSRNIIGELLS